MELIARYGGLPEELLAFAETAPMQRLLDVGMHCGCEYTACLLYKGKPAYSRYLHSLGAAAIVWHFTKDEAQSLSALFHDIATPVFAHVVDFLNGDHLAQESTEAPTHDILTNDAKLQAGLRALGSSNAGCGRLPPLSDCGQRLAAAFLRPARVYARKRVPRVRRIA